MGEARAVLALLLAQAERDDRVDGNRFGRLAGSIANAVLEGVDPDVIVSRLDIDDLVARIDPQAIVDRVDPQTVVDRVDPNTITDRVDVDALLDRVDVDRFLDRVDVDRLLARADLEALVRRARIPELVAESTGEVAGSVLGVARKQIVALDVLVTRALLTLLRRDPDRLPAGPPALVGDTTGDTPGLTGGEADEGEVTGHYAGLPVQLGAHAADVAVASAAFTAGLGGLAGLSNAVLGVEIAGQIEGWWWLGAYAAWLFVYFWLPVRIAGRTLAMEVLGLRVVARDGRPLRGRAALWRTLLLPLTTLPFAVGFLTLLLDRERRALHDRLAGSAVVYDWGRRSARLPTPLSAYLAERSSG